MLVEVTLAVVHADGYMGLWSLDNLEAFQISDDWGQPTLALVEHRSRLKGGTSPLVLPIERKLLARVLFP